MKKIIFILFSLCMLNNIQAQTITVIDATTLQPIPFADVYTKNKKFNTVSNEKGKVDIGEINKNDTLLISSIGYEILKIPVLSISNNKVYLIPSTVGLNEIVISASRFEEKKEDVPFLIETIKSTDIANQNNPTTAELLQQTGAVFVQKSQMGGGSPVIRGYEASRVLIVVDGIRMNNAIYRSGHLQNVIRVDQNMLDRAEIVFGPGAVIYGSDALGGVMHFHTRNPILTTSDKPNITGNIMGRFASANLEKSGHFDLNIGLKKWGFLTSFTFSHFDDLRQGNLRSPFNDSTWYRTFYVERINNKDSVIQNPDPNIQKQSGYYQYDVLQKIMYKQNENILHIVNFQLSNSSNVYRYDRLTETTGGLPRFAEWYYGPERRLLASYSLNLNGYNAFDQGKITFAYQNISESRISRRFNNVNRRYQEENVHVISLNADFTKQIKKHELRFGMEGTLNIVQSTGKSTDIITNIESPSGSRYPDGGSYYYSGSLYFSDTWEISKKFIFTYGGRFNYVGLTANFKDTTFYPFPFKTATQNNVAGNGNIGIIFMPDKSWRFTLLGSTGFRSPNVDDLGKVFDSSPGILIIPNPNVEPEYSFNGELGISKTFAEKIRLEVVGFASYSPGRIATLPDQLNGQDSVMYDGTMSAVYSNQNADNGYILGVNASIHADITRHFSIVSTLNYTYGRVKLDTAEIPMDHIPPVYGKTSFILKLKKFTSEFWILYNGWKNLNDYSPNGEDNLQYATPKGMPAWFTLNLRASYQVIPQLRLQLALENILDWNYRPFASGISAPGRNVIISIRGSF